MKPQKLIQKILFIIVILLFIGCDRNQPANIDETEFKSFLEKRFFEIANQESQVSNFEYQLVSGQQEDLLKSKGKIILLNFWATWCFPCKQEMPDLEELKHIMKDENFRILAVNSGDKKLKIQSFLKKYPYSFDIVVDENRDISNSLNVKGLPTTFILNQELNIVGKIIGPMNWKDKAFVDYLTRFSRT